MSATEILPGLCSITFRQLDVDSIVALAQRAGVAGIEWGADVHVPPGDLPAAQHAAARCADAGIVVSSYGSYLGASDADDTDLAGEMERVFDTAEVLGTTMVRIWTAFGVTPGSPGTDRRRVIDRTAAITEAASRRDVVAALEFHPGTLTDTAASTVALLDAVDRPNLRTHWQPDPRLGPVQALGELETVADRLAHLHVFSWGPSGFEDRLALDDGAELWQPALAVARSAPTVDAGPRYALCEYVSGDDPEQLVRDVTVLRRWLSSDPSATAAPGPD